jgi:hypothetical protein
MAKRDPNGERFFSEPIHTTDEQSRSAYRKRVDEVTEELANNPVEEE